MSAFLVSRETIALLAVALPTNSEESVHQRVRRLSLDSGDILAYRARAEFLYRANCESLSARYGDNEHDLWVPLTREECETALRSMTSEQVAKSADCFDYQACEHDDWQSSEAFAYTSNVRSFLLRRLLGGSYERAAWQ